MAKKKSIKFNSTTLFILIAIVIIIGLLVALAYSPVGQGILDSMLADEPTNGAQNNNNGTQNFEKRIVKLGGNAVAADETVILENVVCQVHFINVGQGDAILIQFVDGTDVLIDAGSGSTARPSSEVKNNYMEYLFGAGIVGNIDYLIATHPDTDHYNMFTYVLESFVVENIMYNDVVKGTQAYETFKTIAQDKVDAEHLYKIDADGETYDNFIVGDGYEIDIIAPGYDTFQDNDPNYNAEESNGMSPMIILTVQGVKVLLTGDATFTTEDWFLNELGEEALDVDVLKVGHHGSAGSTSESFLTKIQAEYAVISSDQGAAYAHPRPELMTRLFDAGVVTYRTSRHGNIVLNIDENGNFAFEVENEVMVENNTKLIDDKMIITEIVEFVPAA